MPPDDPPLRLRATDWRTIDGETIVLDRETERYLSLNRAGTTMWEQLADGSSRGQLVARLIEVFGIEAPRAAADVDAFLAQLRSFGLLESSPG